MPEVLLTVHNLASADHRILRERLGKATQSELRYSPTGQAERGFDAAIPALALSAISTTVGSIGLYLNLYDRRRASRTSTSDPGAAMSAHDPTRAAIEEAFERVNTEENATLDADIRAALAHQLPQLVEGGTLIVSGPDWVVTASYREDVLAIDVRSTRD
jgi:hypothetical protein